MDHLPRPKVKLCVFFISTFIFVFIFSTIRLPRAYRSIPTPFPDSQADKILVSNQSITPLRDTKHFLVSAFVDRRVKGFDLRIIGIFRRDSVQPLHCCFLCGRYISTKTKGNILEHSDNFGFPFVTTDVLCPIPKDCQATHVTLLTQPDEGISPDQSWLPIRNQDAGEPQEAQLQFNFTVCISNLFGDYNNVLQFAQALEMYRLVGVDRVVIYNTSCGPDLDRLLHSYIQDGLVEVVPWAIDQHMTPSKGWLFSLHGGDLHYFGQLTTLNECIYRSMTRSRYVSLNDIDEIPMPYQHSSLMPLMDELQQKHPNTGVFRIENHIFPKKHFEASRRFNLPEWGSVPGVNILEHIYREEPDRTIYHPYKMILRPRSVEQTSVHEVLKYFGEALKVPRELFRLIHVRGALRGSLTLEELNVDKRLWDFSDKLVQNVNRVLGRLGMLRTEALN